MFADMQNLQTLDGIPISEQIRRALRPWLIKTGQEARGIEREGVMPRDFSYTLEKLNIALDVLASGSGELRERLLFAFMPGLQALKAEEDFPPDLAPDFQIIVDLVTAPPTIEAALTAMTTDDAASLAKKIAVLAREMDHRFRNRRDRDAEADADPV